MATTDIMLIVLAGMVAILVIAFVLHYMADRAMQRRIFAVGRIASIIRKEVTIGVTEGTKTFLEGYAEIADKF